MLMRMCGLVWRHRRVRERRCAFAPLRQFRGVDYRGFVAGARSLGWNHYRDACDSETDGGRDWNLIVSCDMPFLTREWLSYLVGRAIESSAQVVVPRSEFGLEPLCACWRTDAAAELESALERGVRKVTEGIALLRAEVLDARDWKRFDSAGRLFWNMNTAADYEEARRIVEAEQS